MNHNWKTIWTKKSIKDINLKQDEFSIFCDLKKADGFDVNIHNELAYFKAFYNDWMIVYQRLNEITQNNIHSVYEVGCGSGVNLYLFQNRIKNVMLGGIDYSQSLINIANAIVASKDLMCGNAEQMSIEPRYDLVMADSVFQYFDSKEYAENVLTKMILKSSKVVYISEIHDINLREEWLAYRRSSMENYDQIYKGLDKMFYSRDWIISIAESNGKQAFFSRSENPEYWNSKYVFNCFIY